MLWRHTVLETEFSLLIFSLFSYVSKVFERLASLLYSRLTFLKAGSSRVLANQSALFCPGFPW